MDRESFEQHLEGQTTRRTVVKTGVKLAYAAPLVAASFSLTEAGALAAPQRNRKNSPKKSPAGSKTSVGAAGGKGGGTGGGTGGSTGGGGNGGVGATKIAICHATCSDSNPYVLIEIDDNAVAQHNANHHKHCPNTDVVLGPASNNYSQADCPGGAISGA